MIFTLSVIGLSTFLIGCLPTYQTAGIWAPILLVFLRLAQGFAVGGEWGGAVLMAVEHTPEKRGLFGSYPQMGVPAGMLLATIVFIILSRLNTDLLINQGFWRIGFLSSFVLLFIGLYIRRNIDETPVFIGSKEKAKSPILEVFRDHGKNVFLAAGAKLVENAAFYIYTAFLLAINKQYQRYDATTVLAAVAIASFLAFITIPISGWLSDLVGRKKVYIAGTIFTGLFAFPFFYLFQTGNAYLMTMGVILALSIGHALMYGPQASLFSELFKTKVRYSGASMGYQIAAVFGGGLFPLLAVGFLTNINADLYIALILGSMAVISTFSVLLVTETFQKNMGDESEAIAEKNILLESEILLTK